MKFNVKNIEDSGVNSAVRKIAVLALNLFGSTTPT